MNRGEFKKEVLNSEICPSNFELIYSEFEGYMNDAICTLKEFHRVCEKYNIQYQLAFGSLIGAVRDQGQIPWDHDIDVMVAFDDRLKLVNALNENLSSDYYYDSPENNRQYKYFTMRISPKEYKSENLHVDVFYCIGAPEKRKKREYFEKIMRSVFKWRYYKLVKVRDPMLITSKKRAIIYKIMLFPICMKLIERTMRKICEKYKVAESKVCIPVFAVYKNVFFDSKKLWDTELYSTEVGTFRITKHYEDVLSSIYKDYHKIYPLELRLEEMLSGYSKITGKHINSTIKYEEYDRKYYAK